MTAVFKRIAIFCLWPIRRAPILGGRNVLVTKDWPITDKAFNTEYGYTDSVPEKKHALYWEAENVNLS
jgi:hypothetical protein